jgi:hypothetical protein
MSNIISGSEAIAVKKCQMKYPENEGWYDSNELISMCTFNAVQFLSNYDLFGVQEVNDVYKKSFINNIKLLNPNYEFLSSSYHNNTSIMTGYDKNILGNGIQLTNNLKLSSSTDDRTIQIIWFKKYSLLFINLHAPHDINLKKEIEKICNNIKLLVKPSKIIMVGDFNDCEGKILNEYINIFGMKLRIPLNNKIPKTCCADVNYDYVGDYILTTDYDNNIYFGLPYNYDRETNLYSDHDPVVLLYF